VGLIEANFDSVYFEAVLVLEINALKLEGDDMSMRSVIRMMWLEFQQSIGI
jgi:hypothetical protein